MLKMIFHSDQPTRNTSVTNAGNAGRGVLTVTCSGGTHMISTDCARTSGIECNLAGRPLVNLELLLV